VALPSTLYLRRFLGGNRALITGDVLEIQGTGYTERFGKHQLVERVWGNCELTMENHGHCLTATAAMMGLALEELTIGELEAIAPRFPVLVTVLCRTPGAARG
jgi:hypothetical protein